MRLLPILFCFALAGSLSAAQTYDVTPLNKTLTPTVAIGAAEDTVTFTDTQQNSRYIQFVGDQPWAISDATGALATKFIIPANTPYSVRIGATTTFYYQGQTATAGILHIQVLGQ